MQTVKEPSPTKTSRKRSGSAPKRNRSAVTNGTRAFIQGDGNSPWFRRFKDITLLHIEDLGGPDGLSEAQLSLCRRAATLEVELERWDGLLSLGKEIDLDAYSRVTNTLRRTLETLGIERKKKDVTPDLTTILAGHARREAAE
jgi:hypothetical protein